jgi:hypothetical protein
MRLRDLANRPGVLGTFAHVDRLLDAVRAVSATEFEIRDVFSPVPVAELEGLIERPPSRVPYFTFAAAAGGLVGGLALCLLSAMVWNIVVGGKPVTAHVPFVVIGFEALILIGALGTFAALLLFARLPFTRFPGPGYRPEFSKDRFGLWVRCTRAEAQRVEAVLREAGAVGIELVEPTEGGGG